MSDDWQEYEDILLDDDSVRSLPVRGVIIVHKAFTVACASQSVLENVDEAAFVMGKMEGTHQRTTPHALPKVPDAEPRVRVCSSSTSECSRSPQLVQRAGPGAPDHPRGVIFVEDAALRARGWTRVPQPPRLADQLDATHASHKKKQKALRPIDVAQVQVLTWYMCGDNALVAINFLGLLCAPTATKTPAIPLSCPTSGCPSPCAAV